MPGTMITHIRRGWRGSPRPQPTRWPVPRRKRSPSARPKHGQGGAAQMLLFRPHGGFFTQALRLFGKSETAGKKTSTVNNALVGKAWSGPPWRKGPSWRNHNLPSGPAGRWKMRSLSLHDLTSRSAPGRAQLSTGCAQNEPAFC